VRGVSKPRYDLVGDEGKSSQPMEEKDIAVLIFIFRILSVCCEMS